MTNETDGGPAFPFRYSSHASPVGTQGMSIRDYFAAAALQASDVIAHADAESIAFSVYEIADAMLKRRVR